MIYNEKRPPNLGAFSLCWSSGLALQQLQHTLLRGIRLRQHRLSAQELLYKL
jgi:hypothetical protein